MYVIFLVKVIMYTVLCKEKIRVGIICEQLISILFINVIFYTLLIWTTLYIVVHRPFSDKMYILNLYCSLQTPDALYNMYNKYYIIAVYFTHTYAFLTALAFL